MHCKLRVIFRNTLISSKSVICCWAWGVGWFGGRCHPTPGVWGGWVVLETTEGGLESALSLSWTRVTLTSVNHDVIDANAALMPTEHGLEDELTIKIRKDWVSG